MPPAAAFGQGHVAETDVDGLTLHVQTAGRDAFAAVSKHLVGGGRAIPGNHLEGPGCFGDGRQSVQQIEKFGIDLVDVARAEVPQEVIHGRQGVRHIRAATEVLDGEPLAGVRMSEPQRTNTRRTD